MKYSHELELANKACDTAIELGGLRGRNKSYTSGYCAIAATWLAKEINKRTPGRAIVACGWRECTGHAWVVLDHDWILDPTHEQFDMKTKVFFASVNDSTIYIDLKENFDTWPAWQKPVNGAIENFDLIVKGQMKPETLFIDCYRIAS